MPYTMDGNCVKKEGKTLKCYDTRADALAYFRALQAAENKGLTEPPPLDAAPLPLVQEGEKARKYSQEEANYRVVSPELLNGRACATCRFFVERDYNGYGGYSSCLIVEDYPKSITAIGVSDEYEPIPEYTFEPSPAPVYIVPEPSVDDKAAPYVQIGADRVTLTGAQGLKSKGNLWVAWWSNNAQDLEGEIFALKAHDNYINLLREGKLDYPELWLAHIPGTAHGKALHVGRIDNVLYAVGEYYDTPLAKSIRQKYKMFPAWEVSHGFFYVDGLKFNKVYYWYQTYEISPLPAGMAANSVTEYRESFKMGMEAWQKQVLEGLNFTPEEIAQIEQEGQSKSAAIQEQGLATKAGNVPVPGGPVPIPPPVQPVPVVPPVQPVPTPAPTPAQAAPTGASEGVKVADVVSLLSLAMKARDDKNAAIIGGLKTTVDQLVSNQNQLTGAFNQLVGMLGVDGFASQQNGAQIPLTNQQGQMNAAGALLQANQRGNPGQGGDDFADFFPMFAQQNGAQP